ncbi:MAG: hypothetical protein ACKV2Q_09535 [Planctomycetaceae bacterium]
MRILLVEDDYLQADWLQPQFEREYPGVAVDCISTELEFRERLDEIVEHPPDVVIIDVMIRWTDPGPNMQRPPEKMAYDGPYRAGLRCQELLAERLPEIPVIFYTVLEQIDLDDELSTMRENVVYLRKDAETESFFQQLRQHLRGQVSVIGGQSRQGRTRDCQ